jgi:hypothetical protein
METMTQDLNLTTDRLWQTIPVPMGFVLRMIGLGFRPEDTDITGDIDRLIRAIIGKNTDHSNVNLHFDEMYNELMLKLAQLLDRRDLYFENRSKFFGFLKTSLTRHKNTLIQRYAYTMKRTGIKHKSEEDSVSTVHLDDLRQVDPHDDDPHKTVKIELDNDKKGTANFFGVSSGREDAEVMEVLNLFIEHHLTPLEALVIRQEMEPNSAAYTYAFVEHSASKHNGKFKIRDPHKAQGIGVELGVYKKTLGRVRLKMGALFDKGTMNEQNELEQSRLAELQLCEIFNIQVPSHVDTVVKRRCFTTAARDNHDKVTPDVAALLEAVGAYAPKKHGEVISCFGVMWEANHRACGLCALREACQTKAANVGLGKEDFHIDKKLLGTKATKTPMILPKIEPPQDGERAPRSTNLTVMNQSDRDEEIMAFLIETLMPILHEGEIYYRLQDRRSKHLFCVGQPERMMQLRFCNPSDKLKSELTSYGKGPMWTVPDDMSLADVKTLMNQHVADNLT